SSDVCSSDLPVVEFLQRGHDDPLGSQSFLGFHAAQSAPMRGAVQRQVRTPFAHAQTRPSTSSSRNTAIATTAPTGRPVNAAANGIRKTLSTSNTRNTMA